MQPRVATVVSALKCDELSPLGFAITPVAPYRTLIDVAVWSPPVTLRLMLMRSVCRARLLNLIINSNQNELLLKKKKSSIQFNKK